MEHDPVVGFGDLARFLRRGLRVALPTALVAGVLVFALRVNAPPTYLASATLVANRSTPAPKLLLSDYQTATTGDVVLNTAWKRLHGTPADPQALDTLRQEITIHVVDSPQQASMTIQAKTTNPKTASDVANIVSESLLGWDAARANAAIDESISAVKGQIGSLKSQMLTLQKQGQGGEALAPLQTLISQKTSQLADLTSQRGQGDSALTVLRAAAPPLTPSSPSIVFTTALAGLLGMLIGYGLFLVRGMTTPRVRNIDDLAALTGLTVLTDLPRPVEPIATGSPVPDQASGYIRGFVELASLPRGPILLLGSHERAGQVPIALALGLSFVRSGKSTLWIDTGRLALPQQLALKLQVKRTPFALEDHLRLQQFSLPVHELRQRSRQALHLISGFGREDHPADLVSIGLPRLLEQASARYDVVIVSSSSPITDPIPLVVAPYCPGSLLIADIRQSSRVEVGRAAQVLHRSGTELLGVIATHNAVRSDRGDQRARVRAVSGGQTVANPAQEDAR